MTEKLPTIPLEVARQAANALYARDRASQTLGMLIVEVAPGQATVSMTVGPQMVNGHAICHGGLVFALADSAFAFACNSYNRNTVAAAATIDFLLPARLGDALTAEAKELWRPGRSGIYEVIVSNQKGERVALFRGRSHEVRGEVTDTPIPETNP